MSGSKLDKISPRWKSVDVEIHELKDGKTQLYLIADGEPLAFWTHAYQNLEMTKGHAGRVKGRLEDGKHVIRITNSELKRFGPRVYEACTVDYITDFYYFLTDEGYNRTILEVKTSGMKDKGVAARIEQRKDEMASVFTKFKRGELSHVDSPPIINKIAEKRKDGTDLSKQVRKWVAKRIAPRYAAAGKNIHCAFATEFTKINEIAAGYHEKDLKNKLNSEGLDAQNATKITDIAYLRIGMVDDEERWGNVEGMMDDMYPGRKEKTLKLNERELALIKRGCTESQKSLSEFRHRKSISGGA